MQKYNLLYILFFLFVFSSCENYFDQVIEVEIPEHTPRLAPTFDLNTNDSVFFAFVGRTIGTLEEGIYESVRDATVTLLQEDEVLFEFGHAGGGRYQRPVDGFTLDNTTEYVLQVKAPGFEDVEARQVPPAKVEIKEAIYEEDGTIDFEGERVDKITVTIDDPAESENYYMVEIAVNTDFYSFRIRPDSNDPGREQMDLGVVFPDKPFNGKSYDLVLYSYSDTLSDPDLDKITVILHSWSRDKYLFEKSYYAYKLAQDNPFAEPAIVHSNCSGEAGIFSITQSSEYEIRL